ncbi:MAG: HEAT repeat domain-containing protein [Candidatus Eisenbacteria bacterium]|uniref:HEAT repeat domain-containing protein n=1 Tax=Eiseniibacteriota bacterium TaxID=2212470 RepID=A0A9D6L9L4_UNCEI|nr:HEAT repeat domain-containing protein [Candidatus Eisenbacteria bacterium]MBI3539163.1 HEAT repeat domain-containing protein [Candidatus Eisenbacteria bacterium]
MTTPIGHSASRYTTFRELSPAGQAAHLWFRQLARALKTCRLYRPDNPVVLKVREDLYEPLVAGLAGYGTWQFRITPGEIWLLDEAVVRPPSRTDGEDAVVGKESMLPFLFYRDGIRGLAILPQVTRNDLDALFDALLAASAGVFTHDDLVTLMWQANTTHIQIEAVPVEQTIYLSSRPASGGGGGGGHQGQSFAWSPSGGEIRADLGQAAGVAQGLHKDTFDDWPLPEGAVDVEPAYQKMLPAMEFARMRLTTEWVGERSTDWTLQAPDVLRQLHAASPGPETRHLLAHSVTTWLAGAIQRSSWVEAQETLTLLHEFDPDGSLTRDELTAAIAGLDTDAITERLDESETDDQARFFALAVALGRPALDLACAVMAKATKSRTRAAACTMLCYLCNDEPELLEPYLRDSRWYVARNAVFVLGQIGGPEIVPLLRMAAQHPEPRVRRQVVAALGSVPRESRTAILLHQLDTRDPQLLAAALSMLTRDRNRDVAGTILRQIGAPDFESRSEENQRTLFGALAEVADEHAVPALEALLHKGGWFARRTLQRVAAARTLERIGGEKALAALETGLRSRSEAVRSACLDAMGTKAA